MDMVMWQLVTSCWRKQCETHGRVHTGAERNYQARDRANWHLAPVYNVFLLKQKNTYSCNMLIFYLSCHPSRITAHEKRIY